MKKLFLLLPALAVVILTATSFKSEEVAPKLYPELETYFKSVQTKNFSKEHIGTLDNLQNDFFLSHLDFGTWNMIFYCSENTFRSQASQVFAQTLCYAKRHKQWKVYSAGLKNGEINSKLIEYLTKIGYKITKGEKEGKTTYEVRFSDKAAPIILFSKTADDKSLPTKDITSVIVCDVKTETDCAALKTPSSPFALAFPKVDTAANDEKIQATLKNIASEMDYITNRKK